MFPLKQRLLPIAVFMALIISSCTSNEELIQEDKVSIDDIINVTYVQSRPIETEILNLINDYRASMSLSSINELNLIKVPALGHTSYMIDQNEISHDKFNERANYLIDNASVINVAENVASGFTTAQGVVDGWIASDSHRETILGNYNYFEVTARQNSDGRWYYTNIFVKIP